MNDQAIIAAAEKLVEELQKGGYDLAFKEDGETLLDVSFNVVRFPGRGIKVDRIGQWEVQGGVKVES